MSLQSKHTLIFLLIAILYVGGISSEMLEDEVVSPDAVKPPHLQKPDPVAINRDSSDVETSPQTSSTTGLNQQPVHEKANEAGAMPQRPPNEVVKQEKEHDVEKLDFENAKSFFGGFLSSLTFVIVSELGDKTFFIAAIMAMRYPRRVVFLGAIAALWLMTFLSILIGVALPTLFIPEVYTHYAAIALFFLFGARLLREAWGMNEDEMGEYEEAEAEIDKKDEDASLDCLERGIERKIDPIIVMGYKIHPICIQVFTMTFLAEWGDRSQIATIALAARGNAYGVTGGGVLGHTFCTIVAVLGGKLAKEQISERTVSFVGGVMFILFGFHEYFWGV